MAGETFNVSGVIQSKSADGKRFKLDNDEWYGCYSASMLKADVGDMVNFDYSSVEKGGRVFHNCKGTVKAAMGSSTISSVSVSSGTVPVRRQELMLPVGLTRERAIIRQSSLSSAVALIASLKNYNEMSAADAVHVTIQAARSFEAYASGDDDIEAAKEMIENGELKGAE